VALLLLRAIHAPLDGLVPLAVGQLYGLRLGLRRASAAATRVESAMTEHTPHISPDDLATTIRKSLRDIAVNPDTGKWEYVRRDGSDHVEAEAALDSLIEQLEAARSDLGEIEQLVRHEWRDKDHNAAFVLATIEQVLDASIPAKNPLRKPGRSSECGHDGWQAGCPVCEREEQDALRAMGERSPAKRPSE